MPFKGIGVEQEQAGRLMRRDLLSAYLATGARLGSWVVVMALVYRRMGEAAFAVLALVRGTLAILNYSALGLAPAMIHFLARARVQPVPVLAVEEAERGGKVLEYARPMPKPKVRGTPLQRLYISGLMLMFLLGFVAAVLLVVLADTLPSWLTFPKGFRLSSGSLIMAFGLGVLLRLLSDASGAVLQTMGRIRLDNALLAAADLLWAVLVTCHVLAGDPSLPVIGGMYLLAGLFLLIARFVAAEIQTKVLEVQADADWPAMGRLLTFGVGVTISQMAEYLYAPVDYILISKLISPLAVAAYAPAVQIDAGLFVLVSGLAAVLLPKGAVAHAGGDTAGLRRYYRRGTLGSVAILVLASLLVWLLAPWIFRLWLGDEMKATQAILPLMLLNVCVGGSAMVGRSILLAMGQVRAFSISVLAAGVTNVVFSYIFVRYFDWGLGGIVLGTTVAVVGRCAVWMPWYVRRAIGRNDPARPGVSPPVGGEALV